MSKQAIISLQSNTYFIMHINGQHGSQQSAAVSRITCLIVGPHCLSYYKNHQAMSKIFRRSKNSDSSGHTAYYQPFCIYSSQQKYQIEIAKRESTPKSSRTYCPRQKCQLNAKEILFLNAIGKDNERWHLHRFLPLQERSKLLHIAQLMSNLTRNIEPYWVTIRSDFNWIWMSTVSMQKSRLLTSWLVGSKIMKGYFKLIMNDLDHYHDAIIRLYWSISHTSFCSRLWSRSQQ